MFIIYGAIFFESNLILPALTPETALTGLWSDNTNHDEPITNNVIHVHNSREKHIDISEIKKAEYRVSSDSERKERYVKINDAQLMANFQLRKTNDKLTLQMCFFFG